MGFIRECLLIKVSIKFQVPWYRLVNISRWFNPGLSMLKLHKPLTNKKKANHNVGFWKYLRSVIISYKKNSISKRSMELVVVSVWRSFDLKFCIKLNLLASEMPSCVHLRKANARSLKTIFLCNSSFCSWGSSISSKLFPI